MAQVNSGIRGFLGYSAIYEAFQSLIGAHSGRQRIVREFVRPFAGAKIVDIGCGPGAILKYLPQDIEYIGYDYNPAYIETAIATYGNRGTFYCADAGTEDGMSLVQRGDFDIALATGLLHHLDDDEVRHLVDTAWAYLKPGGVFVTNDGAYTEGQNPIAKFIVSKDRGRNIRTPEQYVALLSRRFPKVESAVLNDLTRIPYTNFIMRATKE